MPRIACAIRGVCVRITKWRKRVYKFALLIFRRKCILYVKSDALDIWADPEAELKNARLASAAYELYGLKGLVAEEEIQTGKAYQDGMIAYHRSDRDHSVTAGDWTCYMDFADKHEEVKL